MTMQAVRAVGAFALLVPAAIGLAGPASADEPTFTMPSVAHMNLQEADNAVQKLSPGTQFHISSHNIDGHPQKQLSLTHWMVCSQSPAAGAKFAANEDIEMSVTRFFDGCGD